MPRSRSSSSGAASRSLPWSAIRRVSAHLTERDRRLLALLAEVRVLTVWQIARLEFGSPVTARHRLQVLVGLQVLDGFRPRAERGSTPMHYVLAPLGAAVVVAAAALQANEALLDALPQLKFDACRLPEETQCRLYDAFGLELRYHRHREDLALQVTIRSGTLDSQRTVVLDVAQEVGVRPQADQRQECETGVDTEMSTPAPSTSGVHRGLRPRMDARSAPGRIRTYAPASGGRCSIP